VIVLAYDPGPTTCGVVWYDGARVLRADGKATVEQALLYLRHRGIDHVAIERVQSYGIAGATLLATSEVVGRLQQRALDAGLPVSLHYRRDVLRCLDVTGRGSRDSLVRQRLLEAHGGTRGAAVGTKAAPGPLYGCSGHSWAALAVAVTALGA